MTQEVKQTPPDSRSKGHRKWGSKVKVSWGQKKDEEEAKVKDVRVKVSRLQSSFGESLFNSGTETPIGGSPKLHKEGKTVANAPPPPPPSKFSQNSHDYPPPPHTHTHTFFFFSKSRIRPSISQYFNVFFFFSFFLIIISNHLSFT